jgi:hypothetical protein
MRRPSIRKKVAAEIAVEASMLTALRRPRITFSAVNEPERTGDSKSSPSEGYPDKSSSNAVPGIGCGARHLVDHWPLHTVIGTEDIRLPVPSTGRDFTDGLLGQGQALWVGPATRRDHRQELRMLSLGTSVVGVTIEAEHPRDCRVARAVE